MDKDLLGSISFPDVDLFEILVYQILRVRSCSLYIMIFGQEYRVQRIMETLWEELDL